MFLFLLENFWLQISPLPVGVVCVRTQFVLFYNMTNYIYLAAAYLLFFSPPLSPPFSFHCFHFPHLQTIVLCFILIPFCTRHTYTPKLKAIDRPQEADKVPRAPHDRKKEWQKLALGAELAQDVHDDKHREANGSAAYHDNRYVTVYVLFGLKLGCNKIPRDKNLGLLQAPCLHQVWRALHSSFGVTRMCHMIRLTCTYILVSVEIHNL